MGRKTAKGGAWRYTLYFTPEADIPGDSPIKVSDTKLKDFFAKEGAGDEPILQVWIYKHNLFSWLVPKWFGAWHEFTVVESKNWYWSFEKDSKGIRVQRSTSKASLKYFYRGEKRPGWVEKEGRASHKVKRYGETMQDISDWIYQEDKLNTEYHLTKSNCHYFASLLFEAIARQKGRKLCTD